jgi:hypothetical protein
LSSSSANAGSRYFEAALAFRAALERSSSATVPMSPPSLGLVERQAYLLTDNVSRPPISLNLLRGHSVSCTVSQTRRVLICLQSRYLRRYCQLLCCVRNRSGLFSLTRSRRVVGDSGRPGLSSNRLFKTAPLYFNTRT